MISVEETENIRRAFFIEHKSIRRISRDTGHSRDSIKKAIASPEPATYILRQPRSAPVLGPFKTRIDQLLTESAELPPKQRYTGHKVFDLLHGEGFSGSESTVRSYISQLQCSQKRPKLYLPLEYDPGWDAQADWGEAEVILAGQQQTVQLFFLRLCYSRRLFVMAFPTQRQEAFFEGHVQAFHFFQGVPRRIAYDNLKTAVFKILTGHNRQEQQSFVLFRSHYLFESRFCTPGQGHEKGGVEHGVGFGRRNFLSPLPQAASFAELNPLLLAACLADDQRQVDRQPQTIGAAWAEERGLLLPLPGHDYACCLSRSVCLNPYSQVEFETNRYSVPVDQAQAHLILHAYPFRVDILTPTQVIASHPRCYDRHQDIFDPLHYLSLLEQRPGGFEQAKPLRRWRQGWPPTYEQLLAALRRQEGETEGIREFVRVLKLHSRYPAAWVEQAVSQALQYGCLRAAGVELCLRQLQPPDLPPALSLTDQPQLARVGEQRPDLQRYNQLLGGG